MRRAIRIAALLAVPMLGPTSVASAANPMVIPTTGTGLVAPELAEKTLEYPEVGSGLNFPKQYGAIQLNGYISLSGAWQLWPVAWDDVGSGRPVIQGSIGSRWRFGLPGKYSYHCECALGVRGEGDVYVVGPRPRITAIQTSPDNTPPVRYTLDASASSVTDWTAYNIVRYDFDLNADSVYGDLAPDQSGPEPTAPIAFDAPGDHVVGLRVWDDHLPPRSQDFVLGITVPKQTTAAAPVNRPEDNVPRADDKKGDFGNSYKAARVAVKTRAKIKFSLLRRNGLSVKVTGLTSGDVVAATLTKGTKRRKIASKSGRASSSSITLRIRLGKKAAAILRAKPRARSVRLGVNVEGSDGFTVSKAKNVRIG